MQLSNWGVFGIFSATHADKIKLFTFWSEVRWSKNVPGYCQQNSFRHKSWQHCYQVHSNTTAGNGWSITQISRHCWKRASMTYPGCCCWATQRYLSLLHFQQVVSSHRAEHRRFLVFVQTRWRLCPLLLSQFSIISNKIISSISSSSNNTITNVISRPICLSEKSRSI